MWFLLVVVCVQLIFWGFYFFFGFGPPVDQESYCARRLYSVWANNTPDSFDASLGWTSQSRTYAADPNLSNWVAVVGDLSSIDGGRSSPGIFANLSFLLNDTNVVDYTVADYSLHQSYLRFLSDVQPKRPQFAVFMVPITSIKKNYLLCGIWYRPSIFFEAEFIGINKVHTQVSKPKFPGTIIQAIRASFFSFSNKNVYQAGFLGAKNIFLHMDTVQFSAKSPRPLIVLIDDDPSYWAQQSKKDLQQFLTDSGYFFLVLPDAIAESSLSSVMNAEDISGSNVPVVPEEIATILADAVAYASPLSLSGDRFVVVVGNMSIYITTPLSKSAFTDSPFD